MLTAYHSLSFATVKSAKGKTKSVFVRNSSLIDVIQIPSPCIFKRVKEVPKQQQLLRIQDEGLRHR